MRSFKKPNESRIQLHIEDNSVNHNQKEDLQRTEKWHKERLGRWTSSQMKNLMSCSSSGSRLDWNDLGKIFYFGKTAIKYIYENAKERQTGKYIDSGEGTKEMCYGTRVEPLINKIVTKELKKIHSKVKVKDVGFVRFKNFDKAGVSSDGVAIIKEKGNKVKIPLEYKACTSWQTHYDRTFDLMSESSKDFWQVQAHMKAWEAKFCYYAVAEPPQNIEKYLYYSGDIMDMYKEFKKECKVHIQKVERSESHQNALMKRILIAEKALNEFLEKPRNLRVILEEVIDYCHNNQDELIQ